MEALLLGAGAGGGDARRNGAAGTKGATDAQPADAAAAGGPHGPSASVSASRAPRSWGLGVAGGTRKRDGIVRPGSPPPHCPSPAAPRAVAPQALGGPARSLLPSGARVSLRLAGVWPTGLLSRPPAFFSAVAFSLHLWGGTSRPKPVTRLFGCGFFFFFFLNGSRSVSFLSKTVSSLETSLLPSLKHPQRPVSGL